MNRLKEAMLKGGVITGLAGLALLGGCVQGPPPAEAILEVEVPSSWGTGSGEGLEPQAWVRAFGDSQLDALVNEAVDSNFQLQAGVARLEQAMAIARIEGAERLPSVSLTGGAQRSMSNNLSDPPIRFRSDRFDINAVANWEFDLWGRVRAQALAGGADAAAAESDFRALRLSIATRVAQAWFAAIEARQQEALAMETLTSFEANLTTVEERFKRGLSPALDLRLTRANVAGARSTYNLRKRLADTAVRQLEVLLGRYPSGTLAVAEALPELEGIVPAGVPSDLLLRRPDLLSAEQRVAAADYRFAESKKALLPSISLTARYGRASADLEDILKDSFDVWSLAGNLTAPLFQGGRLRANVDRSEAALAESIANYQNTALTAFREVESALVGEELLREQLAAVETSAEESVGAQELAEERYERGLVDIITVLESQRRAFTARSNMLSVKNDLLQNRLALYLALGGDY
ncbi:MAG: efflux transporter outer membrane subunit [Puniceicoccaceae bacterium]